MFRLERLEVRIIIFLSFTMLVGLGLMAYGKSAHQVELEIKHFDIEGFRDDYTDAQEGGGKVDINEAEVGELTALKNIGGVLARRIVDYRSRQGRFWSIDDIKKVKGIGEKLFNKIKDDISV